MAVGDDTAVADVEASEEDVLAGAVLGAEGGAVEGDAGGLADEVGAEGADEAALNDEDVCAEDLARGDLTVGMGPSAGGVDDVALSRC